jgi:hypothetical protein
MSEQRVYKTNKTKIRERLKDEKLVVILLTLIKQYKQYCDKNEKDYKGFKYHYFRQKNDLIAASKIPERTTDRRLTALTDLGYIKHKAGYNSKGYKTTYWFFNIEKIRADFNIDLEAEAPPKEKQKGVPVHTPKPKQDTPPAAQQKDTASNFDFNTLSERQKSTLETVWKTDKESGLKLLNDYKYLFENKGKEYKAFIEMYNKK